jgi:hypothetical protein
MSAKSSRKTYKRLCEELEAVIDEIELHKRGESSYSEKQRIGLWNDSVYLSELFYIKQCIEKDIIPHLIVSQTQFYKALEKQKNIPEDIVLHIASFGDIIDTSAEYYLSKGINPTIDELISG